MWSKEKLPQLWSSGRQASPTSSVLWHCCSSKRGRLGPCARSMEFSPHQQVLRQWVDKMSQELHKEHKLPSPVGVAWEHQMVGAFLGWMAWNQEEACLASCRKAASHQAGSHPGHCFQVVLSALCCPTVIESKSYYHLKNWASSRSRLMVCR